MQIINTFSEFKILSNADVKRGAEISRKRSQIDDILVLYILIPDFYTICYIAIECIVHTEDEMSVGKSLWYSRRLSFSNVGRVIAICPTKRLIVIFRKMIRQQDRASNSGSSLFPQLVGKITSISTPTTPQITPENYTERNAQG